MDETEIDPAIAAAMGFSSFGSKRRKHNSRDDNAVVASAPASTGANNMPLGTRPAVAQESNEQVEDEQGTVTTSTQEAGAEMDAERAGADDEEQDGWTPGWPSQQQLAALRRGVRNKRGDMVVFLPSFVEDPWKGLG